MTEENQNYIRTLSVPSEKQLASVAAWPGEVVVTITAYENILKPDQARAFAELLVQAAEDAEHIVFKDETLESLELADDRAS